MAARDAVTTGRDHPGSGFPGRLLLGSLLVAFVLVPATAPVIRGAEPYTMETVATYVVDPAAASVDVSVAVTFTNTTPNPAGRYSVFRTVPIAVQDGATNLAARDATGALAASLSSGSAGTKATVTLRTALRYQKAASFTVEYRLPSGANPQVRVGASALMVPVWSYGTSGTVSVQLPAGFTVVTRGSALTETAADSGMVLDSGPIADPSGWLAILTATMPGAYTTVTRSVPLAGGTMDLQVRAWNDDPEWATKTLDLLARGLPALQDEIGLPYTGVGPMVVSESLPVGADQLSEPTPGAQEIAVSYLAAPFTVLHQAAHVWLGAALIGDRWIREGVASEVAERAAQQLGLQRPFDPAEQARAHASAAVPLASWSSGTSGTATDPSVDTWAYAASWDLTDRIAATVGQESLQQVLLRVSEGIGAYEPINPGSAPAAAAGTPLPLDSRRFLDQLEQVSGHDLDALFSAEVFAAADQEELAQRAVARADYATLSSAAGDWGVPGAIQSLMAGWHFADARTAVASASAWLQQRDAFIADVRSAGLATPGRLRDLWRSDGGDATATAELQAEAALVAAYRTALDAVGSDPNPIERLGLLGAPTPKQLLDTAAGLFADGDLTGAAGLVSQAVTAHRDAQSTGVVRLAIILAVIAVVAAAGTLLWRRLRPSPA